MMEVPTITIAGLSNSEKRAVVIADNRLPERAVWDFDLLREHFKDLIDVDFEVELTGFTTGEVDLVMDGKSVASTTNDPADDLSGFTLARPAVSHLGDVWELARHRLICGDARRVDDYERLMCGDFAQMTVTDPPFNVPPAFPQSGSRQRRGRGLLVFRNSFRNCTSAFLPFPADMHMAQIQNRDCRLGQAREVAG